MKKLIQTRLVTTHKSGNCLQTVLACLFDLPVEEVPDFSTCYWTEAEQANIIKQYEKDYKEGRMSEYTHNLINLWWLMFNGFVASQGYKYKYYYPHTDKILPEYDIDLWLKDNPDKFYTASGESPRSTPENYVTHICIYQNGKLYHDPHPSQAGLVEGTIYEYKHFYKIDG